MGHIINVNGQKYNITNWNKFSKKLLNAIGFQTENEMRKMTNDMRLVDTGEYKRSFHSEVRGNELTITNTAPHAIYLEYGTYDYFRRFGISNIPSKIDPKKKDISKRLANTLPKGMQPFAVMRRTLWNQNKMGKIITKAVKAASK
ncbi:hypothetical protein CL614_03625 [archaeon]|nr:hypothetical protein [archaeon]